MNVGEDDELVARSAVTAYACALDERDWEGLRELLGSHVLIDYASLSGTAGVMDADVWVDRCRVLEGFDSTLHRISNIRVERSNEGLVVRSYVDAIHFVTVNGKTLEALCCGSYKHVLQPDEAGFGRIVSCALHVTGFPGGRPSFDNGFDVARARFAQQRLRGHR